MFMDYIYKAKSIETGEWLYGYYVGEDAVDYCSDDELDEIVNAKIMPSIIPVKSLNKTIPIYWGVDVDTLCKCDDNYCDIYFNTWLRYDEDNKK